MFTPSLVKLVKEVRKCQDAGWEIGTEDVYTHDC